MVNFKQLIGLVILSIGVIVMIYAVRESQGMGVFSLGAAMTFIGGAIALLLNHK